MSSSAASSMMTLRVTPSRMLRSEEDHEGGGAGVEGGEGGCVFAAGHPVAEAVHAVGGEAIGVGVHEAEGDVFDASDVERRFDLDVAEGAFETLEVVIEVKEAAIEDGGDFVDAVAPEESAVKGGDMGVAFGEDFAVEVEEQIVGHEFSPLQALLAQFAAVRSRSLVSVGWAKSRRLGRGGRSGPGGWALVRGRAV